MLANLKIIALTLIALASIGASLYSESLGRQSSSSWWCLGVVCAFQILFIRSPSVPCEEDYEDDDDDDDDDGDDDKPETDDEPPRERRRFNIPNLDWRGKNYSGKVR